MATELSTTFGYVSGLSASGSGPPRTPLSSASIAATSSAVSEKSKTSKFSAMRCGLTDFGIAQKPCSRCQRRTTCAGVLPYLAARSVMTGSVSGPWDSSAPGT